MREEELRDTTAMVSLAIVLGTSVVFVLLLLAVMSLAFWRRYWSSMIPGCSCTLSPSHIWQTLPCNILYCAGER